VDGFLQQVISIQDGFVLQDVSDGSIDSLGRPFLLFASVGDLSLKLLPRGVSMSVDFVLKGMSVDKLVDGLGEFVIHDLSVLLQEMGNVCMKFMDRVSSSDMSHVVDNVEDDLVAEVLLVLVQVVVDCSSVGTGLESSLDMIHVLLILLDSVLLPLMSNVFVDNLEHSIEMLVDWASFDDLMEFFNISVNIEDQVSSGCPGFSAGIDALRIPSKLPLRLDFPLMCLQGTIFLFLVQILSL
jgi:hypothetical protein